MKKINKSQFAKLAGVSRMAITKATKETGSLFGAVTEDKKINLEHSLTRKYLKDKDIDESMLPTIGMKKFELLRGKDTTTNKNKSNQATKAKDGDGTNTIVISGNESGAFSVPNATGQYDDLDIFLDMSLREVTDVFGTVDQFKTWLEARRLIEDVKLKEMQSNAKRGEYIPRALVEQSIFPFIDSAFVRLVEDLPETLSSQLYNKIQSGYELHDVTVYVRDSISKVLKGLKENSVRLLDQ
jgi:hypothetical protein